MGYGWCRESCSCVSEAAWEQGLAGNGTCGADDFVTSLALGQLCGEEARGPNCEGQ